MRKTTIIVIAVLAFNNMFSQETTTNEVNKLRTELLESKISLLDTRIELLEQNLENKIFLMDSLNYVLQKVDQSRISKRRIYIDTIPEKDYKYTFSLNPVRLFEGSFLISCDRKISENMSIDLSFMGTYVTKNGMGGNYLETQSVDYLLAVNNQPSYIYYNGEIIAGWGVILEAKNYLSAGKAPFGLYAAPQLMYRKVQFIGSTWNWETGITDEITTNMDVIRGGVLLGAKIRFADVLCLDISLGGVMRLSKYFRDSGFTKFQPWYNMDYSGVLPTVNIKLGILK
jgi:hypothetical protein